MIKEAIEVLQSDEWLNTKSENIEIAKGKFELPKTYKGLYKKLKRKWQSKNK